MASTIPSGSWPYRKAQRPSANLFAMLGARIAKGGGSLSLVSPDLT